jgi:hypothetical protein
MKKNRSGSQIASQLFTLLMFSSSLGTAYGEDDVGNEVQQKDRKGRLTDQEYKEGMEQKKLRIADPAQALKEDFWNPCASVALGDGYSVIMQFRHAHPMVAEYHRRVMIFSGGSRRGKLSGSLQLQMNFGGRTHILIYRHLDKEGTVTHVTFEAREGGAQSARLKEPDFEKPPEASKREYIGLISGEAYPLKFVTPLIVSEESARKKLK